MLCPPPPTLNPVTIFETARLSHRANPSRAAGSFYGQSARVATFLRRPFRPKENSHGNVTVRPRRARTLRLECVA
jgi:hypothetical protein